MAIYIWIGTILVYPPHIALPPQARGVKPVRVLAVYYILSVHIDR